MDFILCQGVDITLTTAVSTNPEQKLQHFKLDLPSMKSRFGEECMVWPEGRSYRGMVSGLKGGGGGGLSSTHYQSVNIYSSTSLLPNHHILDHV